MRPRTYRIGSPPCPVATLPSSRSSTAFALGRRRDRRTPGSPISSTRRPSAVRAFRQEHGIERGGPAPLAPITPDSVVEAMLAEEAAALEAGPEPDEPAAVVGERPPRRRAKRRTRRAPPRAKAAPAGEARPRRGRGRRRDRRAGDEAPAKSSRRRGARGGAGRKTASAAAEPEELPPSRWPRRPLSKGDDEGAAEAPADDDPVRGGAAQSAVAAGADAVPHAASRRAWCPAACSCSIASVTSDATFQEHWARRRRAAGRGRADAIVLRRAAADAEPDQPAG